MCVASAMSPAGGGAGGGRDFSIASNTLYFGYEFSPSYLMLSHQSLHSELRFKNTYGYADYAPTKIHASASPPP
ncbi:hypothetical protein [Candidatus Kuenenia stuttgartiensis]|uniref:hypothetical protein n=1 Tax=Kuenenia stuttgartiensis TaxID=174633 RepID=UPI0012FF3E5E|nr:hypothetical protein [Candidatus Kuenenia stuttgartiensis]